MLFKNMYKLLIQNPKKHAPRRNASNVAFIGLGNMGSRMATNLVKMGEKLRLFDVNSASCHRISGGQCCSSPAEAARNSSIVITMLPNGETVKQAILGDDGVLNGLPKNSLLIDCSTIEPNVAQELSIIATANGCRFIDAPVSGGVAGAEAATLAFMVGGERDDVAEAEHLLLQMGSTVFHCGKAGAGQIAKLCNNLILGVTMAATAEGMNLGAKLGLDVNTLAAVVNASSGRSWSSEIYNPVPDIVESVPSSRDYEGGFACKLMAKDLGLAEGAALNSGAPVIFGALAHQIYRTLIVNGYAEKDFSVIYQFLKGES